MNSTYLLKQKGCFLFAFFLIINVVAQKSDIDTNSFKDYNYAMELYNNKGYEVAQKLFLKVSKSTNNSQNLRADASYYEAICAVKLNKTDADKKILNFVEKYPNSGKKEKAFLVVGNYYFVNKKRTSSLKWYQKVNQNLLNEADKKELNFKMGYALLISNYLTGAKKHFKTLLNDPKYGSNSRYYFGYIAYKQKDYDTAETTLTQIADVKAYKSKATYYLLDINFKAGKFKKCIEIGKKILHRTKRNEKSEISKIIGESYFNLKEYAKAIPYLIAYKGKKRRWNNTDYYQLGYAYFKQNDFRKAINYFNKIIVQKNKISQNAYYHLGECYLNLKQKLEALNAFKSASEMPFDKKIKEDAALNYAKLSYEEGNPYKDVPSVLQDYLNAYPKSKHTNEIKNLLITSYLYQQNYQGALEYLNKHKNLKNNKLANEISLYRGIQLFNEKKIKKAYSYFLTATNSQNKNIKAKANYWIAEKDYLFGNFKKALNRFKSINNHKIEEANRVNYAIAYCYFKLKEYKNASNYFQKFIHQQKKDVDLNNDALIRLGDSYYASKNYSKAIESYKVAENNDIGADYALYQEAMSNGFLNKNETKIQNLLTLINNYNTSNLQDDALFELGTTYTSIKNNKKAQTTYDILLKKHPKSAYLSSTLLRQGLLFYSENKNEKALSKFKKIVSKYPNSNEAKQAVSNVKNVYIDIGKVDEYATWVKNIKFVNVSNADLDNATYESAENKFLENNTQKATEGFKKYLQSFPDGLSALKAHFYLAKLLVKNNKNEMAIPHYEYVVNKNQNEFSEEALNKLSQLYLEKENWTKATPLLIRLEQEASRPQNIAYAQSNLMKQYYQTNNYKEAIIYAEKILANRKIKSEIEKDAQVIIARSAFKIEDFLTAEDYYTKVSKNATDKLKAEVLYYNAYFKYKNKEYKKSNKIIQKLIANYSSYKYWGVKSYIIMAKNYYALKDAYQATYILENIIKNFTQYKDIIEEAKNELKSIKNNEAKTNESVNSQN